jgi:hypothetical protein
VKAAFPDGNPKIIDPGTAFSAAFDKARQASFVEAATEAFSEVFDAALLEIKPLQPGEPRDGKIVLEVDSLIRRGANYFIYTSGPEGAMTVVGLLFGIGVDWKLRLSHRDGKELYVNETISFPASNIRFRTGDGDPDWAVYSILMDSAYSNYSREVVGNFGLTPPTESGFFVFKDYGR